MTGLKFTYRSGQRPLDGYTLKRGVGQGGFGEVYFAVSDGGKEVALKLLRGDTDVELRGIAQCLNLKHPNLVHLYDLRTDARGDHWVVMEYVSGESLAQVINRHPSGLPLELIREWFRRSRAASATCTTTASSTATSSRPTSSSRTATSRSATTACRGA